MATRTTAQLVKGVRQLANVQNSTFVLDREILDRINEALKELYDLILSVYEHYYESAYNFTLTGGQSGYTQSLAALSFYKDNTLELNPGTSNMRVLNRLPSNMERDSAIGPRYEIKGTPPVLSVFPPELSAGSYCLRYTPDAPVLGQPVVVIDLTSGINAVDGTTKTWTFANAAFDEDNDTGKTLTIAGATNPINNGNFVITEVVSETEVKTTSATLASEALGVGVTASYVEADTIDALDTTLNKWYMYVQIRAAIDVHRKRDKLSEAMELAGSEADPRPGTLAYERRNVLTMSKNRQEQPRQVPLGRRRSSFWDDGSNR